MNLNFSIFKKKTSKEKFKFFTKKNQPFSVIYAQQISREYADSLFKLADKIRKLAKTKKGLDYLSKTLSDKRAMLFFVQPSTRTFLSFLNACHILGVKTSEIRDVSTSSEIKGESQEDSIRTFSSFVDIIIMRHKEEGFAERAAYTVNNSNRPVPIINGGSGKDEHPTQALLDLYTINRAFKKRGGIDGKKIVMVGDLKRGRTTRSLAQLLANYDGVEIIFVAPKELQMRTDVLDFLKEKNVRFSLTNDMNASIKTADAIYCTRMQDEHDENGESKKIDFTKFYFTEKHLKQIKKDAIIMHPFPRRGEIAEAVDSDLRAHYWKQSRNGMWIRAALILKIFGRERLVSKK